MWSKIRKLDIYAMANLQLTSINSLPEESLAVVEFGTNRKWKIITLILVVISLILIAIIIIIIFKRPQSYRSTDGLTTATSSKGYIDVHSTTHIIATTNYFIDEQKTETTATSNNVSLIYIPSPISSFREFQTSFGLSLSHSIYFNYQHISEMKGYVTSVTIRLFTSWKGDDPLYIFALKRLSFAHSKITHRYPLIPKRNNTEWQTIQIPLRKFPLFLHDYVAIGMQDKSDTNQIYAVNSTIAINGNNVTNNTRNVLVQFTTDFYGIAFIYTIFECV